MQIDLQFPENTTRLSGYEFGEKVFEEQVEFLYKEVLNQLDIEKQIKKKIILNFPNEIKNISNSFVKGFISIFLERFVVEVFYNFFTVKGSQTLKEDFKDGLFF